LISLPIRNHIGTGEFATGARCATERVLEEANCHRAGSATPAKISLAHPVKSTLPAPIAVSGNRRLGEGELFGTARPTRKD
jgi:hypothetical protein